MNLLVPYSATNKKIVMGLLSYIPEFKDFKRLQEEIEEIATNPSIKCWLWKESESDNFIGLIGGESTTDTIIIKYLSVSFVSWGKYYIPNVRRFSKDGR